MGDFNLYDVLRDAVDAAVDSGFGKAEIIYDLRAMIEEVEGADDIPVSAA